MTSRPPKRASTPSPNSTSTRSRSLDRKFESRCNAWEEDYALEQRRRIYTLPEANSKVPGLEARFGDIARRTERARSLEDQVSDLEIAWGAKVLEESCPEREDYLRYRKEAEEVQEAIRRELAAVAADGIEVKDLD